MLYIICCVVFFFSVYVRIYTYAAAHAGEKASLLYFSRVLANSRPQKTKKSRGADPGKKRKEETKRHVPRAEGSPSFFSESLLHNRAAGRIEERKHTHTRARELSVYIYTYIY